MKKSAIFALTMALGVASSAFAAEINDKLEINGEVRANYKTMKAELHENASYDSALRTRLEVVYKPFEDLKLVAMAENEHDFRFKRGTRHHDIALKQLYAEGKFDKVDITVGRVGIGIADGNVLDDDLSRMDSVMLGHDLNDKLRVEAFAAQNLDGHDMQFEDKRSKMLGARLTYSPAENTEIKAEYASLSNLGATDVNDNDTKAKFNVLAVSASTEVAKDLNVSATYIRGKVTNEGDDIGLKGKNGYVFGLSYRGAEAEQKGSWGVKANYYNQGGQTFIAHAIDGTTEFESGDGFKGWSVGADYAIAKNLVAEVSYYDTKDKGGAGDKDRVVWSALTWSF